MCYNNIFLGENFKIYKYMIARKRHVINEKLKIFSRMDYEFKHFKFTGIQKIFTGVSNAK